MVSLISGFELPSGTRRPDAGLHFGSLLVGQPSSPARPSEYISRSRVETITNRLALLGMYILDVWANHQDNLRRSSSRHQMIGKRFFSSIMAKCSEAQAGIFRSVQVLLIIWKAQSTQNSGMKKQYLFGFLISYDSSRYPWFRCLDHSFTMV